MRWSFPIGRVSGIGIRLHVTFLILLVFIGFTSYQTAGLGTATWTLAFLCGVFGCIVLHELGHSLVAQQLGIEVRSITLLPIGGVAALRRLPENPWHEIAITLAGPMVNAAIAALLIPLVGWPAHLFSVAIPHNLPTLLSALVSANITLFLFNFIPAFPMDGGRLVRATLALGLSYPRATSVAAFLGQGIAVVFVLAGLTGIHLLPGLSTLWLLIIGVFIFLGAEGEERLVKNRHALGDRQVLDVMSRVFVTVAPTDPVGYALQLVYQTGQDDFPVCEGDRWLGLVNRADLVDAANRHGLHVPVTTVLDPDVPCVTPQMPLKTAQDEIFHEGWSAVPVLEAGRLVGLLSVENLARYIRVQAELKPAPRPATPATVAAPTPAPPLLTSVAPPIAVPPPPATPLPPAAQP
jgi:Zn-dependent protease